MVKTTAHPILELIEADHRQVEELFAQFEKAKSSKKQQEYFNQIYKELTLHAEAEELVFYPAMEEYEETRVYIEEAEEGHNSVKILLEQMRKLKLEDPNFSTKIAQLKENVMHHVEEEESDIFVAVSNCMTEEQLTQLGEEFDAAKTRIEPEILSKTLS